MIAFDNFAFKLENGWAKGLIWPILETGKMNVSMHALFFLTKSTHLKSQKLVIFELQLYPINRKIYGGYWNLVIMTLGDTSTYATHIFWRKFLSQYLETILIIFLY